MYGKTNMDANRKFSSTHAWYSDKPTLDEEKWLVSIQLDVEHREIGITKFDIKILNQCLSSLVLEVK